MKNVKVVFLVGQGENRTYQEEIEQEARLHQDIIQVDCCKLGARNLRQNIVIKPSNVIPVSRIGSGNFVDTNIFEKKHYFLWFVYIIF